MGDEKKGIQNLKELADFGAELTAAIVRAKADGKVNLKDLGEFLPVARAILPAVKDIGEVPGEFADLDQAERDELSSYFADKFNIPNDKVEAVVEKWFRVALDRYDAADATADLFKEEQGAE